MMGLLLGVLASWAGPVGAQDVCRGDVNDDGIVDAADIVALSAVLFDPDSVDAQTVARADVNDDGAVGADDVVAVLLLNGFVCGSDLTPTPTPTRPTATPSATPSAPTPTPTVTLTPTQTFTPPPTPTPTATCVVQNLSLGTTNGELTTSDCQREFNDSDVRYTDVYEIVGTLGQAITINVTATATGQPIVPYVAIIDAAGQFDRIDVTPPIEFVVTAVQPYFIYVTSQPGSAVQLGTYQVAASVRTCPTPTTLSLPSMHAYSLGGGSECPDPADPADPNDPQPVDVYTFTIAQVPTSLQILMRQTNYNDDIDPVFSVIGPEGFEIFSPDEDDDAAPPLISQDYPGLDAGARFLATVPGTYTLYAGGNGGLGGYSLSVTIPGSPACAPKPLGTIPSTSQLTKTGQLFGDYTKGCSPPLPIPGISDNVPEPNSGADLYTFTAQAGDVISAEMDSDDDAHLFLYGPASAGNPRVAQDDDSLGSNSQLAATLALPGTYTLVAANNNALAPPDPTVPGDQGDIVNYTFVVQKCGSAGVLADGGTKQSTFGTLDCVGFGGVPFRTYSFSGSAGEFVSVAMTSPDIDAAVRLLGPDGSQVYNDNDPFDSTTTDARVNRILPVGGTYFVEVSGSLSAEGVDLTLLPGFSVRVQSCPTVAAAPIQGALNGVFQETDCELTPGRKFDVYSVAGPVAAAQRALSISPPANGCVMGLYAEGLQTPDSGCSATDLLELPATTSGTYGLVVAANDATVRGAYTMQFRNCPLTTLGFGDSRNGSLSGSSCTGADGVAADWYLARGNADLVRFNGGVCGEVTPGFGGLVTDFNGDSAFAGLLSDGSDTMLPLGGDLAALIKVSGMPPGTYTLNIDPASVRQ